MKPATTTTLHNGARAVPSIFEKVIAVDRDNLDATVVAQEPRLAASLPEMAQRLAQVLQVEPAQVNVKAKTAEKLGPVGQGQAIEARAVVLLQGVPRP